MESVLGKFLHICIHEYIQYGFRIFLLTRKSFFMRMQIVGNVQKMNSCFIKLNVDLQRVYTKEGGGGGGGAKKLIRYEI